MQSYFLIMIDCRVDVANIFNFPSQDKYDSDYSINDYVTNYGKSDFDPGVKLLIYFVQKNIVLIFFLNY